MQTSPELIRPNWDCPKNVVAYCSTRVGGSSLGDFKGLNVGAHVGDEPEAVKANRNMLPYIDKITWLEQVHGNRVTALPTEDITADASSSSSCRHFCAVMTADCVPILLCDNTGTQVAAVHAGWKGLESEIIANAVNTFSGSPQNIIAWIGPAISGMCYEVDETLARRFGNYKDAVIKGDRAGKFLLDLPYIAEQQLKNAKVGSVTQSRLCTYSREDLFFSHRRATHQNKSSTGRMVSVIGLI